MTPKGYWVARVDVHDPETYKAYFAAAAPVFTRFGARFLVRNGEFQGVEGTSRGRNVVLEFASYADALACYHSAEYQAARELRAPVSEGDIIVVEGYDGPQP